MRVEGKFNPTPAGVRYDSQFEDWRATALVRNAGMTQHEAIEDRVVVGTDTDVERETTWAV